MSTDDGFASVTAEIDAALELLRDYSSPATGLPVSESFSSLLDQCRDICASFPAPEPVRSIHHFACTGGTLLSKCIAALPGVVLLSEIDPLSELHIDRNAPKQPFAPADIFTALRTSLRDVDPLVVTDAFRSAIAAMTAGLSRRGQYLVIRDHPHSQFCTDVDPDSRPSLRDILSADQAVLSVVTVRHPMDSFLSLRSNGWVHFSPDTMETYSARYLRFLDRHPGLPIRKYEDFVADPAAELEALCALLSLPFRDIAIDLIQVHRLSGDSGRNGKTIAPRPRRNVPPEIDLQRGGHLYRSLCHRLGYEP